MVVQQSTASAGEQPSWFVVSGQAVTVPHAQAVLLAVQSVLVL